MNRIDRDAAQQSKEFTHFWRHPRLPDLCLLRARFMQQRYDLHTHPTYVVALITQGCERLRIGTRQETAPAGTVIIVHPEECHDGEAGAEQGWAYRTLYPPVALMTEIAAELGCDGPPVFARRVVDDANTAHAIATAHRAAEHGEDDEAGMMIALRHLIAKHADHGRHAAPIEHDGARRRLAHYVEAIDANLVNNVELQSLADLAGVTRFQVIRDFRRVTGLTPGGFVRNRRLRLAGHMIEQGVSLADAASAAGFADQSHLSRSFRRTHGITPRMFRQARTVPAA